MSYYLTVNWKTFGTAFKSLRLRAGISSLREFCVLLADKNFVLEESTLSRWQGGSRIPRDRRLVMALIQIFVAHSALRSAEEANRMLRLANLVPLSEAEHGTLGLDSATYDRGSIPPKPDLVNISNTLEFMRRKIYINDGQLQTTLYGLPGTGKSSMAVFIAHELRAYFDGGVVFLDVAGLSIDMIEKVLSETILSNRLSRAIKADTLASIRFKNFLIIFDNVQSSSVLADIYSRFRSSSYIVTTTIPPAGKQNQALEIKPLSTMYVLELFSRAAYRQLDPEEKALVADISHLVGYLAFPLSYIARSLGRNLNSQALASTLHLLETRSKDLPFFQDNFQPIINTFEALFYQLTDDEKSLLEAVSSGNHNSFHISELESGTMKQSALRSLCDKALIETDYDGRYRLHPLLYRFLRVRAKTFDFSGVWRSLYTYQNSLEPKGNTSTHQVKVEDHGDHIYIRSLPNAERSVLTIELKLEGSVLTGTWREQASPLGRYKGQVYNGALQLLISPHGKRMKGKAVFYNNELDITSGSWEIVRSA